MCQRIWTPPPLLFNGTQNTCMEHATYKYMHESMQRCKMFEQVWITWHWRGEALCPGQKVNFTITLIFLISWREKNGYTSISRRLLLDHLGSPFLFLIDSFVSLCAIQRAFKFVWQPWSFTLPQPIVVIYVPVLCPLTKEESSSWSSWSASIIVTHFQIFGSNGNRVTAL